MATFKDLSDKERISNIKDALALLLDTLCSHPDKLAEYIKVEKPVIAETLSAEEKVQLESKYAIQQATFDKVSTFIRGVKKQKGCVCAQGCFDIQMNGILPPEFEPLLVAARKIAEERVY